MKITSLTIGIPAYNEGKNLLRLIGSLLDQDYSGLRLDNIIISSDGSTDSTAKVIRSLKYPKLKLFDNSDRKGKSRGLNQIIKNTNSDILVLLDADIEIKDRNLMKKLILPIINNSVQLTSGSLKESQALTFMGKTISLSMQLKGNIFNNFNSGNNLYNCHGPVRAMSKKLYSKIIFPSLAGDDMYTYLYCIKKGFTFFYVRNAQVFYQAPENYADHGGQSIRFFKSLKSYENMFGKKLMSSETSIPSLPMLKGILQSLPLLILHPFNSIAYFAILSIMKLKSLTNSDITDKWTIAHSSKIFNKI